MFIVLISQWVQQIVQFTPPVLEHTLFMVSSPLVRIQCIFCSIFHYTRHPLLVDLIFSPGKSSVHFLQHFSLHQVPLAGGWKEAAWNEKLNPHLDLDPRPFGLKGPTPHPLGHMLIQWITASDTLSKLSFLKAFHLYRVIRKTDYISWDPKLCTE